MKVTVQPSGGLVSVERTENDLSVSLTAASSPERGAKAAAYISTIIRFAKELNSCLPINNSKPAGDAGGFPPSIQPVYIGL